MRIISQIISWIFMPLFMPIYALLLVMFIPSNIDFMQNDQCMYAMDLQFKKAFLYMFLIFAVLAPGISFILLKRSGLISSLEMDERRERFIPILVMAIYCLVLFFYILYLIQSNRLTVPTFIVALPLSGAAVTTVFLIVNRWKKISIHAASAGILTGFVLAYILRQVDYQLWVFILSIVISGLVMSARLYLQKHTFSEVLIGWCIGGFITFVICFWY
jgi:membrane-associated phospholipid phosphatase